MKTKEVTRAPITTIHFHGDNNVHPIDYERRDGHGHSCQLGPLDGKQQSSSSPMKTECSMCYGGGEDDCTPGYKCESERTYSSYHVHDANAGVCHDMIQYQKMCKCLVSLCVPNLFCSPDDMSRVICVIKSIMRNISIVPYGMEYTSHGHWTFNEYPRIEVYRKKKGKDGIIVICAPPSTTHVRDYVCMLQRIYELQSKKCARSFCLSDLVQSKEYIGMKRGSYENACSILYTLAYELKIKVQIQRRLIGNTEVARSPCAYDKEGMTGPYEYMAIPDTYQFINVYTKSSVFNVSGGLDTISGDYDHAGGDGGGGSESNRWSDEMRTYNMSGNTRFNQLSQLAVSSLFNAETQNKFIEKSKKDVQVQKMMDIMQQGTVSIDDSMKFKGNNQPGSCDEEKKNEYLMMCATKNGSEREELLNKLNGFLANLESSTDTGNDAKSDKYKDLVNQIKSNLMQEFSQNSKKYISGLFEDNEMKSSDQLKSSSSLFDHLTGDKSLFEFITDKCSTMIDSIMSKEGIHYMLDNNTKAVSKNIMSNTSAIKNYVPPIKEDTFNCFTAKGVDSAFERDEKSSDHTGVITYNNDCVPIRKYELETILRNNEGMSKKKLFESRDPDMQYYKKKTKMSSSDKNSSDVYDHEIVFYQPDGEKKYLCLLEFKLDNDEWKEHWKDGRPFVVSLNVGKDEMKKLKKMGVEYEKYEPVSNASEDFMEPYNLSKLVDDAAAWKKEHMNLKNGDIKLSGDDVTTRTTKQSFELKNNNIGHDRLRDLLKTMNQGEYQE